MGVTTNRNGPVPDCSRRLSSCFWSGAFNSHTVTEVTTDITDTPYRTGCHEARPTWLSSVCAHAFSRLSTTVGSHGRLAADVGGNMSEFLISLNSNPNLIC